MSAIENGREIKVGFVTPLTGSLAAFGVSDKWCVEKWMAFVGDGQVLGDGQKHPIKVIQRDSQSDSNRAAQVAGDLINNDKIDMMMAASTPTTVPPVADQCEAYGTPCVSYDCPWQSYYLSRNPPAEGFKWTYNFFFGVEQYIPTCFDMWGSIQTNKIIGGVWPNDPDGNAQRPMWTPIIPKQGYKLVDGGPYPDGMDDFTAMISAFKNGGTEILQGLMDPPDFTNFWKQAHQQSLKPKMCNIGKALLFPTSAEALGDLCIGLLQEIWWHPTFPFKSSLTGQTSQELADDFEKSNGQWTQPLGHYVLFEMVFDSLKRTKNVDDKQDIAAQVRTMKLETMGGPIDFTTPVAENTDHPVPNCYRSPLVAGQWIKGTKWPYEQVITTNTVAKNIPAQQTIIPLP